MDGDLTDEQLDLLVVEYTITGSRIHRALQELKRRRAEAKQALSLLPIGFKCPNCKLTYGEHSDSTIAHSKGYAWCITCTLNELCK